MPDTNAPLDGKDSRQLFAPIDLNKDYTTTTTYGTKRGSTGELLFETLHIFGGILKMAGQAGWRREGRAATQSSAIIDEAARVVRGRGSATWGRSGAGRGGTHSYYRDWPFDWR